MEKKDSKFKWKTKNNGLIFGLCLVGIAAFSALFATGQVKHAQKEKNQLAEEQAALDDATAKSGDTSFAPQIDEALQNALDQSEGLDAAQTLEEMSEGMEEVASNDVTARIEEQAEDLTAEAPEDLLENAVEAQTTEILPTVAFEDADVLNWPVVGSVLLDYSMDGSIYFPTLQQYKYNPALIIGSEVNSQVVAAAKGIVESIDIDEETGTTVTMSLGNGYKLKYGQLKELTVAEGDVVNQGDLIGYVSEPTKYYCKEGSNLYFAMTKDETPVDPVLYLE